MISSTKRYFFGGLWLALLVVFVGSSVAFAQTEDVIPQSKLNPDPTFEPQILPDPINVPGKEYSNDLDKDSLGNLDPGQVVHWGGDGVTVWDSFDYCSSSNGAGGTVFQVDALANIRDNLFLDLDGTREAVYEAADIQHENPYHDTVSLLVSFQDNSVEGYEKNIYSSRSSYRDGSASLWAEWETNINAKPGALDDVDGLELHGPDRTDDANMYSREDDPSVLFPSGAMKRCSVFRFKPDVLDEETETYGVSVPYLATQDLLDVVIDDNNNNPTWDVGGGPSSADFDLDAMMLWDVENDDEFGTGDMILFSVRPIAGLFDGGEIWLYKFGEDDATFLVHGLTDSGVPRVWNTAHEVSLHFFGDNVHSENINALEALAPEPSVLTLILVGGFMAGMFMLRRFRG